MNLQVIKNRVFYWIKSLILYTLYIALLLIICSFFLLQIPAVQTSLTQRYLKVLSEITGFKTTVEGVDFRWFDRIVLNGVSVTDSEDNTMIYARVIEINFQLSTLQEDGEINIDAIDIDSAHVFLKQIQESDTSRNLNLNIFINALREKYQSSGDGGSGKINIGEALLENSRFTYDQSDRDSLTDRFDHNHFSLDIADGQLQNFLILGDTIEFDVRSLSAIDRKTKFDVKNLSTFFRICQKSMEFHGLNLRAGNSTISDTVIFTFNSQLDLSEFIDKVTIESHFTNTVIHPTDLAVFAPGVEKLKSPIKLNGKVTGLVSRFKFRNMDVQLGNTNLIGSLDMDGLPDFNETFILLNLTNSTINFDDLSFAYNEKTADRLKPLGSVNLQGQFLGYPTDFVAKGDFKTRMGRIISDINFKVDEESFNNSSYKGQLSMIDFNLGTYLGDTLNFQKITMNGRVSGSGLTQSTANFILNGKINSIGIRKYNYTNITTDARFASQFFNGQFSIRDPNLKLTAEGFIDLRNNRNQFNIDAVIDTVNFYNLHLSKDKVFLQSNLNINFRGLNLDSLAGNAHIESLLVGYNDQSLSVKNLDVLAERTDTNRSLEVKTTLVDAKAEGNFNFSNLFNDVKVLVQEFLLGIKNDKNAIATYYARKQKEHDSYEANFHFKFKNLKPISDLLNIDLDISSNTELDGKFVSGNTTILRTFAKIDSLRYQNLSFFNSEVEFNASKIADSTQTLALAYINSSTQNLGKYLKTKNLISEAVWNHDHIDFNISLDQEDRDNYIQLDGEVDFNDSTNIRLNKYSEIKLLDKLWVFNSSNKISVKGKEINIHKLTLSNKEESIGLNGMISQSENKKLTLAVQKFDLSSLNDLSQRALAGTVNAEVILSNFYDQYNIQNIISINELRVDNFLIGTITGNNVWDTVNDRFNLEFYIDRIDQRIVNCNGYYNPNDRINPLNVSAQFNKANLRIFEPFIDDIFSKFNGTLTGTYRITGSLDNLQLNGEARVENGQLMVNYLKTLYQFTGTIGLTPSSIYFKNIILQDLFKNTATLSGTINHVNFGRMEIDLNTQFNDFQLLNTSIKDNDLFYGQGYASGDVSFKGPLQNLKITSSAKTEKNTRIYIPIGGTTSTEQKDFINFVSFSDSTYKASLNKQLESKIDLSGITMDLNIDVTPDAYCEIIFDAKAGDIIRGRGNGKIKLQLDTKGEFNMFGPIEFTEGAYNFTLYDIINKEFEIQSGSRISWFGDPYQGQMDIKATYNQLASLAPILSKQVTGNTADTDQTAGTAQLRRKYPVQVLLKLEGPMLSPQINFDILAKDLPQNITVNNQPVQLAFEFNAFKNRLDEQELKRQVFSLIILRRFSPLESFNTSGSLVNSVSELFSNQLSYWMSQVDENLEIDVDLGTMDQEAFNTFQLRLSYTFLNGRLRVTRDGTFGNQTSATNNANGRADLSSMAGDWTVDYLLTPDGKFKVKMYSRTNVNPTLNTLGNQSTITTGVSLLHTQSFNELKDLLQSNRNRNQRNNETNPAGEEEALKEDDGSDD